MEETKAGWGSIIATVLIIIVVVVGALYFWGKRLEESKNAEELLNESGSEVETILDISADDDLSSIEAELNTTNLELDAELQ